MQLLHTLSAFFGRSKPAATRRAGIDFEDLADMQAAMPRRLEAPATLYSNVSAYLGNMPIHLRQQVMIALYDTNFYVEHLTDRISHPILGKTGYLPQVEPDAPATQEVLDAFWETDGLTGRIEQKRIVRDFLVIGEVFDLVAPCGETFYTAPILQAQVNQTLTDPRNYHKLTGVKQETEPGFYVRHPLVVNEQTLSPQAKQQREQWRQAGGFDCFFAQNLKKTAPIPGNALEAGEYYQKRGEPFLFTSADLFKQLLDYLWTSIDRAQSLNTFNWGFGVTMPDRMKNATQAEQQAYMRKWQDWVGTPKPNSAFFYPANILAPQPFSFPAGVASALEGLFKLMRNAAGWTAASRDEDMGDSDSRFAAMKQPGVTNPTVETLIDLQLRIEEYHYQRANYVLNKKADEGVIPRSEYEMVRGQRKFKYRITSPEISKQDFGVAAATMNAFEQGWNAVAARGVYTLESLVEGEKRMVKELYGIDLETDTEALATIQQRQQEMLAQPVVPEQPTAPEVTESAGSRPGGRDAARPKQAPVPQESP